MQLGSPFDALHEALAMATSKDLPDIEYWARDWKAYNNLKKKEKAKLRVNEGPGEFKKRRPSTDEVEVIMFSQTWSSTALGYGGMGGAAMTPAYTVIVRFRYDTCVYFGCGRLAYAINCNYQSPEGQQNFKADLSDRQMADVSDSVRYQ